MKLRGSLTMSEEEKKTPGEKVSEGIDGILIEKKKLLEKAIGNEKIDIVFRTRFTDREGYHYIEFQDKDGLLKFIKYKNGKIIEKIEYIEFNNPENQDRKIRIYPAPQIKETKIDRLLEEFEKDNDEDITINFPGYPQEYGSEKELFEEIRSFIHSFVELPEYHEIELSFYPMKSVLFDVIKTDFFPFVHIIAPLGKGKSRLLNILYEIIPFSFIASNLKSAALIRISDLYKAVAIVDEVGDLDEEMIEIVNSKFNKKRKVIRAHQEIQHGYSSLVAYSIFGPIIMAGRTPFSDDATETKSIQIDMNFEMEREDIPIVIEKRLYDEFIERAHNIRNKLLMFRIKWHDKINDFQSNVIIRKFQKIAEKRLVQTFSFFEDFMLMIPEYKEKVIDIVKEQIIKNVEVNADTPNGMVANIFLDLYDYGEYGFGKEKFEYDKNGKHYKGIFLSAIYEQLGENYKQQVGKIIKKLGLTIDRIRIESNERDSNGNEIKKVKLYRLVRIPDEKKILELRKKYSIDYINEQIESIRSNISNLDTIFQKSIENTESVSNSVPLDPTVPLDPNTPLKKTDKITETDQKERISENKYIKQDKEKENKNINNINNIKIGLQDFYIFNEHTVSDLMDLMDQKLKEILKNTDSASKTYIITGLMDLMDHKFPIVKIYLNPNDPNTILIIIKGFYNQFTEEQKKYLSEKFQKIDLTANEIGIDEILLFFPIPQKKETLKERTLKWFKDHNLETLVKAIYELDDHTIQVELKGPWDLYDPETQKELKAKFELVSYWGHIIVLRTRPQEVN